MYRERLPIFQKEITVLTVNRRLSFHLQQQLSEAVSSQGNFDQKLPRIMPIENWLLQTWEEASQSGQLLLSDFQVQTLWQQIIREESKNELGLHIKATASLAKSAWETLIQWNLSLDTLSKETDLQTETFLSWAKQFEHRLAERHFVCLVELPRRLKQLLEENQWRPKQALVMIGFDEYTPALDSLMTSLKSKIDVMIFEPKQINKKTERIQLNDTEIEIRAAALWAKKYLQSPTKKPRIGILVPNLPQQRASLLSHFTDVFTPENILPTMGYKPAPFNISAGQAFNDSLMINAALRLLALSEEPIRTHDLCTLLHSPYLHAHPTDTYVAAAIDDKWRIDLRYEIDNKTIQQDFSNLIEQYSETTFPSRWHHWCESIDRVSHQSSKAWALQFEKELTMIGWPGEVKLNALETARLIRWNELLGEFSAFDQTHQTLSRVEAINLLTELTQHTVFQVKSNEEAPIQIMGLLESVGHEFDYLWVMGLSDETWPAPAKPNPFLPISLQRKHNMPHASAKRELFYAKRIQDRLLSSAKEIIFSSPKFDNDRALGISALIKSFSEITKTHLKLDQEANLAKRIFLSKKLDFFTDNQALPVQENELIRGGKSVLQYQSDCPFQAFAKIRLNAHFPPEPTPGLSAMERGNLIHLTLEAIWKKIKTQAELKNYSDEVLSQIIVDAIEKIIRDKSIHDIFLHVEKIRIKKIITEWLNLEKKRPPFHVNQCETSRFIKVGSLSLRLRIDRLDEVDAGGDFIIDYKTKKFNTTNDWLGERPKDLQLPLYCTYASANPVGIAYAQVRGEKFVFKGLSILENHSFSEVKPISMQGWNTIRQEWKQTLERLAKDFAEGVAKVDPENPDSTCRYCDLHALCRIE